MIAEPSTALGIGETAAIESRRIVAVLSAKGGVGKTTVAANLSAALAASGRPVYLVDLDSQNAARLCFRTPFSDPSGHVLQDAAGQPWSGCVSDTGFGVRCVPFGLVGEPARAAFEHRVASDPDWLRAGLASLDAPPDALFVLDTPPGGSVFLTQVLGNAGHVIGVVLADAASYATVPTMERWFHDLRPKLPPGQRSYYLVNRMDDAKPLARDVYAALREQLGYRLLGGVVHFDGVVEEALASQLPVSAYAAESRASRDFRELGAWLASML